MCIMGQIEENGKEQLAMQYAKHDIIVFIIQARTRSSHIIRIYLLVSVYRT